MSAEALNCPNCGGGVESDRTVCEFCKTRLKTVACVKCLGLMFAGTKFCGHCGAVAAPVNVSVDAKLGDCPRCRRSLEALVVADTTISDCQVCDGIWIDVATFEAVCADNEKQAAVLGFFQNRERHPQSLTKVSYVPCPNCGQLMNRNNFAKASGVIVDICKQRGIWFDADELPAIMQFIRRGGMDQARERERLEIAQERQALRDEARRNAGLDVRSGSSSWSDESDGIRGFVRSLFD